MYRAEEAFVTGTLGGITPVTQVDGRPIAVGPVTAELDSLYRAYAEQA